MLRSRHAGDLAGSRRGREDRSGGLRGLTIPAERATSLGTLTSTLSSATWEPTAGSAGSAGEPGQGGGGGSGGCGGSGGTGEDGQGGAGGIGFASTSGNSGGNGGNGAGGSGGGGGSGGLSAGIVFQGSAPPTIQGCTFTVSDPGHGGPGGTPGSGSEPWSGVPGAAGLDEYAVYDAGLDSVKTALEIF